MPTRKTRSTRKSRSTRRSTASPITRRHTSRRVARPWTNEENSFMRKFYSRFETAWVARQMGRTVYSVRYKAVDLGIKKASPSIWRGNHGTANAFKACCKGNWRKPVARKTKATKRNSRTRTWRATSRRTTSRRKTIRRRTR